MEEFLPLIGALAPSIGRLFKSVGGAAVKRIYRGLKKTKVFHSIEKWPVWAQHAQLRAAAGGPDPHGDVLGNRDRHGLFHFLAANGLDPAQAGKHVMAGDYRTIASKGGTAALQFLQHSGYQQQAERHVSKMVQDATTGKMWDTAKRFMSLNLGRVVKSREHEEYLRRIFLEKNE